MNLRCGWSGHSFDLKISRNQKITYFYLRNIRPTTLNRSSLPGALCPPSSFRLFHVRRCFGCRCGSGPWAGSSMLLMIAVSMIFTSIRIIFTTFFTHDFLIGHVSYPVYIDITGTPFRLAGASRNSDGVRFSLIRGNFLCGWLTRPHRISQAFPRSIFDGYLHVQFGFVKRNKMATLILIRTLFQSTLWPTACLD